MPSFTPTPPPEEPTPPIELEGTGITIHPIPGGMIASFPKREDGPFDELLRPAPKPALRTTKTRVYQLRLTPEQWDKLKDKAEKNRRTVADFIRTRCGI